MKNLVLLAGLFAFVFTVNAQTTEKGGTELKAHVCSTSCGPNGHVYAHGEKGHVHDPKAKGTDSKEREL